MFTNLRDKGNFRKKPSGVERQDRKKKTTKEMEVNILE